MALTNKLKAIADAIRGKTGKTEEMTLDQMATEIAGIQSGGGADEIITIAESATNAAQVYSIFSSFVDSGEYTIFVRLGTAPECSMLFAFFNGAAHTGFDTGYFRNRGNSPGAMVWLSSYEIFVNVGDRYLKKVIE